MDIRSTLIDKAAGDIHTRITNAKMRSGAYLYADIYKWFTETSGLGLAEQAVKLIAPDPVKKEEDLAEALEQWESKCNRLTRFGSEHALPDVYKKAALKKMLVGESVRNFDLWTAEGMSYDKLILKLKDYARSKQLDGEARKGKQAVDIGRVQDWSDYVPTEEEQKAGAETEYINALTGVKCYICRKKGHVATNCPKRKGKRDKGKGKGKSGKGGKGDKGAPKGKATGPKGGC